jgi:F-type H+-transporting ATPase subunit b
MQVDWITVAAQIVNFLVLVWLLQRFLYLPITRAMALREERIAVRLREAAEKRAEAESEAADYREKQQELERRREQMLTEAQEAAERERKSLERTAKDAVEQHKREWLRQLQDQREEFLRDLRESAAQHFYTMARRALGDLADAELEEQIVKVFLRKLAGLRGEVRAKIAAEGRRAGNAVTVSSRFEIATHDKSRITKAIHDGILDGAQVTYRPSPEMTAGLELKAGGQTVSWNLDSYFDDLESRLATELGAGRPASG